MTLSSLTFWVPGKDEEQEEDGWPGALNGKQTWMPGISCDQAGPLKLLRSELVVILR